MLLIPQIGAQTAGDSVITNTKIKVAIKVLTESVHRRHTKEHMISAYEE